MNAVRVNETDEELICRTVARHFRPGRYGAGNEGLVGLVSSYVDAVNNQVVLVGLDGKTTRYDLGSFH